MYKISNNNYMSHFAEITTNYLLLDYELRVNDKKFSSSLDRGDNLPFVVLIGGVGGSGKSSFIDFCKKYANDVYEESTIDCVKLVASYMRDLESSCKFVDETSNFPEKYFDDQIDSKSDEYRTLLHKIKSAWCEFDDGPNKIIVDKLKDLFTNSSNPFLVFINVREPDQINHLRDLVSQIEAIPITLCVTREDYDTWTNCGDRDTYSYNYDIVIENDGTLDDLKTKAQDFCLAVADTCRKIPKLLGPVLYSEVSTTSS